MNDEQKKYAWDWLKGAMGNGFDGEESWRIDAERGTITVWLNMLDAPDGIVEMTFNLDTIRRVDAEEFRRVYLGEDDTPNQ